MAMGLSNIGLLEEAWQEFERNSLHWQATVTPQQWSGIWTSGDFIGLDGKAGSVGNNYPAFCMHRHAWYVMMMAQSMVQVQCWQQLPCIAAYTATLDKRTFIL